METQEVLPWILLFVIAAWSLSRTKEITPPRLLRLERKMDHLLRHFEIDPKEARMDLREAKEAVENFEQQDHTIETNGR